MAKQIPDFLKEPSFQSNGDMDALAAKIITSENDRLKAQSQGDASAEGWTQQQDSIKQRQELFEIARKLNAESYGFTRADSEKTIRTLPKENTYGARSIFPEWEPNPNAEEKLRDRLNDYVCDLAKDRGLDLTGFKAYPALSHKLQQR